MRPATDPNVDYKTLGFCPLASGQIDHGYAENTKGGLADPPPVDLPPEEHPILLAQRA